MNILNEESELPLRLPSAAEMAAFDAATIKAGTPSLELMERAGGAAYEVINERILQKSKKFEKVVVLCGPGNNGGDGFVIARGLLTHGYETSVILAASDKYSSDCHIQARKLNEKGFEFLLFGDAQGLSPGGFKAKYASQTELTEILRQSDLVVDALLGTGQKSAPRDAIASMIEILNAAVREDPARRVIVSIDTPSGINADNGQVFSPAVSAHLTVTIELIKRGMMQYPARQNCGEIVVQPIGIINDGSCEFSICQRSSVSIPHRPADFHKGMAGHVLVLAGSKNMPGAAALCSHAALKSGLGLLTMCCLSGVKQYELAPEIMLEHLNGANFGAGSISTIKNWLPKVQTVLLGPGLGQAKSTQAFVNKLLGLIAASKCNAVIDADALNIIARQKKLPKLANCIITPHPGEAARLLSCSTKDVQADRYQAARELHRRTSAVVVLKGASTIIYSGRQGFVCGLGNPYMAAAGSGDVLSGIIAGILAQFAGRAEALFEAAKTGVFIHARAGDLAHANSKGPIVASEIINFIGNAFNVV